LPRSKIAKNVWSLKVSLIFFMILTKNLSRSKRILTNSWRPREVNSQDSISCQMMIFLKLLVNQKIQNQFFNISLKCLRELPLLKFKKQVEAIPKSMRSLIWLPVTKKQLKLNSSKLILRLRLGLRNLSMKWEILLKDNSSSITKIIKANLRVDKRRIKCLTPSNFIKVRSLSQCVKCNGLQM
jgi:hypothetical protein